MSDSPRLSRNRASYTMEFKLGLVEKSYQPGACVAHLAREHGINDNLPFTWRQRYHHLLPDDVQRDIPDTPSIIPVVVSDMPRSASPKPAYETGAPAHQDGLVCDVTVGGASLRLTGSLSPMLLKALIRELRGGRL